jgi:hypothetical protein
MPRARTTQVTDPVQTTSSREGGRRRGPFRPLAAGGAAVLAVVLAGSLTSWGRFGTAYVFVVLNFYIGVVTLVALSLTVMAGLVSTDRIMLRIGHRVLFQGLHRATSILAMVALGVHIAVKVLEAHASIGDVVVPFFSQGRSRYIGFGTIASYLMLAAFWSGLARTRFIGSIRPWLWRVLHCSAYASWLVALAHGLNAGRQAATWVTVSYIACVVGVALALLVRIYPRFGRYSPGTKTERAVAANGFMPRFQDGPMATRVPLSAPRSPVDLPTAEYQSDLVRPDGASPDYAMAGQAYWPDGRGEQKYPAAGHPDLDYPDGGYLAGGYPVTHHHDYWAQGDQSREVHFGRWTPESAGPSTAPSTAPPARPRLRLITNDEPEDGSRHSRGEPRDRRRANTDGYRAG